MRTATKREMLVRARRWCRAGRRRRRMVGRMVLDRCTVGFVLLGRGNIRTNDGRIRTTSLAVDGFLTHVLLLLLLLHVRCLGLLILLRNRRFVLLLNVMLNRILVRGSVPLLPQQRSLVHNLLAVPASRTIAPSPHAHIPSNAHSATLLGHNPRQRCRLRQPRKLLGRIDGERLRLDIQAMRAELSRLQWIHGHGVHLLLCLFIQRKAQAILALVSN